MKPHIIQQADHSLGDPAILQCECNCHVFLEDPLDNDCQGCGRTYNMSGQQVTHSSLCDAQGNPLEREP